MKKFLSLPLALLTTGAWAQTFVSTTPENKNVVLEEFTGIYCTYCPDGHRIANDLADANQGDVVLINIHTGSFANPNSGDPDFTTSYGAAIAGQTGLTGYPAGSVNRSNFSSQGWSQGSGTAMSRSSWGNAASSVLGESSPVNTAVLATYDATNGTIEIDVEVYYTGNANMPTNKLNVAILQNNVEGPQTGAANFYPQMVLPNGNYNHQHMLRDMVTGQWGDDINTTTAGSFFSQHYSWNIPTDINGIPVEVHNLKVAVFVAEGQQDIITGSETSVSLPNNIKTDLSAVNITAMPEGYCDDSMSPSIEVTNNFSNAITSFDIQMALNGGAAITETFTGNLGQGQTTTINFSPLTLVDGVNSIQFYNITNINGGALVDTNSSNHAIEMVEVLKMPTNAVVPSYAEGFEGAAIGEDPTEYFVMNPHGHRVYIVDNQINSSVNWNLGAYELSAKSYRIRLDDFQPGQTASIMSKKVDLSTKEYHSLTFDYAYSQAAAGENSELKFEISTDCGNTWTTVYTNSGDNMRTTDTPFPSGWFYPDATGWASDTIQIHGFDGEEAILKITATEDNGNCLYLDNIHLDGKPLSVGEEELAKTQIFPNPVNGIDAQLIIEDLNETAQIRLYDVAGKLIHQQTFNNQGVVTLPTAQLNAGVYLINIVTENGTQVERIVVQ